MSLFHRQLVERQPLACRIFDQAVGKKCLSHAYLLTGHVTNDKYLLSRFLSCYLNCEYEDKDKNGYCLIRISDNVDAYSDKELPSDSKICRNCRWIWAQAHPQAWLVLSGKESKSGRIAVEKARELSLELSKESPYTRTIVIPDATRDCFHAPAANALLKTIEEPCGNNLFLLFAPEAASVTATIVSRCQVVPLMQTTSSIFKFPSENEDEQEKLRNTIANYAIYPGSIQHVVGSVSQAMQWAAQLELAAANGVDTLFLLDWIVSKEFEQLKDRAVTDLKVSAYLDHLINLAQTTKDQLDNYVQPKAAFESFALSLASKTSA